MLSTDMWLDLVSVRNLKEAWDHVNRHGGDSPGGDGQTKAQFSNNVDARLERLSFDLESESYAMGPIKRVRLRKPAGGHRELSIPTFRDRVAQRAALQMMLPELERRFENSSFAYRPGRSVKMAGRVITAAIQDGYSHIYESDIDDYFDNVPHAPLLDSVYDIFPVAPLRRLLKTWLDSDGDPQKGLPQGAPISPILANLYLDPLDEAMQRPGWIWVRFADDFVCLTRSARGARAAQGHCRAYLTALGLSEHPDKTQITTVDEGMRFLGRRFSRDISERDFDGLTPAEDAVLRDTQTPDPGLAGETNQTPSAQPSRYIKALANPGEKWLAEQIGPEFNVDENALTALPRKARPRYVPLIRTVYMTGRGQRLSLHGKTMIIQDETLRTLWKGAGPDIDRIDIGPHGSAETAVLRFAARQNISIFFVDGHGRTLSCLARRHARRAPLHLAQAALILDDMRRLDLARIIVGARLQTQNALIRRWVKNNKEGAARWRQKGMPDKTAEFDDRAAQLHDMARRHGRSTAKLDQATTISQLLGFEGDGARQFYAALRLNLRQAAFGPRRQSKVPVSQDDHEMSEGQSDGVGAVLDVCAWLLARDIQCFADKAGLHPGFGVLHTTQSRFDACVYDLIEEFRAPIAESLAVQLFNKGPIKPEVDFVEKDGVMRLTQQAMGEIIRVYEAFVTRPALVRKTRHARTDWRGIMQRQITAYSAAITDGSVYRPYKMDY